ncbi:MAG TPA: hypothetical protein PK385_10455 [Spirochaetota bacterium]|nr:hypothetical protein [Spirochaetota bacterium]HOS33218.1 hypothetical protein [Spirochaetota bacterium]HOS56466.1 hypothetical protein [Spirochaetota bacterium]HPK61426.1 hypothetical protein [Spirochaetota bacterium]HQF78817.1 hypothetical protein [Spirochaetota bacterium]
MRFRKTFFLLSIICLVTLSLFAEKIDEENALAFLSGNYILIGKKINSKKTYSGRIRLQYNEKEKRLDIKRVVAGVTSEGIATIEYALSDQIPVLKIKFTEKNVKYEGVFLWRGDLDNFGRISGYIYFADDQSVEDPGLEAYFISQDD